jgi:antitoxin component of RelBE/YafQ-DinJ toxin-antitoxin module
MKEEGIKIRIDSELKEKFKKVCKQESITMSDKIHKFIIEQIDENKLLEKGKLTIKINEQFYIAEKKDNKLILDRTSIHPFGYLFFKKWKNEMFDEKTGKIGYKKDYAKTIDFIQGDFSGVFEGVFVIDVIDGIVTLSYDNKKIL